MNAPHDSFLNSLPAEWGFDRLKDVSAINAFSLPANMDAGYEFDYLEISNVNYHGVIDPKAIERLRYEDAPSRARRRLAKNCTAISSVRPNLQAVAFIGNAPDDFVCSTGFNVVQPASHKLSPKFVYYSLLADGARQYFEAAAKGVGYPAVDDKDFQSFVVPLPPLPEQQGIAAYLDASCAAIDAAVAAKRRQLETLDALASSIINRAVTRGLEVHASFTRTGVDWFPEIPPKWRVARFKSLFCLIYRYPTYFNIEYVPEGIPEIRGEALTSDGFIETLPDERYISPETAAQFPKTRLECGDIVMSVRGTMGKIGLVNAKYVGANITANLLRLSPDIRRVTGEFLRWLMRSTYFNEALNSSAPITTIKTITMPQLAKLRIALPPKSEQQQIVIFLEKRIAEVKRIASTIESQIATLTAYRKSLIHECVTGQRRITEAEVTRVKVHG